MRIQHNIIINGKQWMHVPFLVIEAWKVGSWSRSMETTWVTKGGYDNSNEQVAGNRTTTSSFSRYLFHVISLNFLHLNLGWFATFLLSNHLCRSTSSSHQIFCYRTKETNTLGTITMVKTFHVQSFFRKCISKWVYWWRWNPIILSKIIHER
jgi:hypothetical protein